MSVNVMGDIGVKVTHRSVQVLAGVSRSVGNVK